MFLPADEIDALESPGPLAARITRHALAVVVAGADRGPQTARADIAEATRA